MAVQQSTPSDRSRILLESGTNEVEFLEFFVGGSRFGVNVAKVIQTVVWDQEQLTRLPGASGGVLGTMLFRNRPMLVVDLRTFLQLHDRSHDPEKRLLLVTEFNQTTFGFVIDEIAGIRRVSWEAFQPLDTAGLGTIPCVTGAALTEECIVLILDLEALMAMIDPAMRMDRYVDAIKPSQHLSRDTIRMVYAEDSPLIQRFTVTALRDAGFRHLHVFSSGKDALDYITSPERDEIDLIISDIEMPAMDGLALCRQVRALPDMAQVPFIFYSSLINDTMKRKCEAVGATASYSKPEIHELVNAIEPLCLARQATPVG
jgi:two-component system chemotaxis response regulator CheV